MSSSPHLIPSIELVRRVSDIALAYTLARMRVLERISGNPVGIAYRTIGGATALSALHLPSPAFNSVVGLRAEQANHVQPIVEWYRGRGTGCRLEIAAGDFDPDLGQTLARKGFYQSGFHAALIREPDAPTATPGSGIAVEPVTNAREMEDFLDAYVAGWAIPEDAHTQFKANVRSWLGQPGWSLYVARTDGRGVAAGILFLYEGAGYLADSATDPVFRRRGLQAAMVRRRLQDAAAAGVDVISGGADFLSASHRNMERAGMRLLFLRTIWTPLASAEKLSV